MPTGTTRSSVPKERVMFYVVSALASFFPLIFGLVLAELFIEKDFVDSLRKLVPTVEELARRDYRHLGDMLTYYALASFHFYLCAGVVCWYWWIMRPKLPERQRRSSSYFLLAIALLLIGLIFCLLMWWRDNVLNQVAYHATCEFFESAPELPSIPVENCGDINKLMFLAWMSTFLGMLTVAFAATFAVGNSDAIPEPSDPNWHTVVEQRTRALQNSVYALSLVLVSSTVSITAFARLPLGLLSDGEDSLASANAIAEFATGIGTFFGLIFSLTLLATFAVPTFLLFRRANANYPDDSQFEDKQSWLHEHVFGSVRSNITSVFSIIAPVLVGPLSGLFANLSGAG